MQRTVLLLIAFGVACSDGGDTRKRRRTDTAAPVDTMAAMDIRHGFVAPAEWEQVSNPSGLTFRQPQQFTLGLNAAAIEQCNDSTPQADTPIFDRTFMERWPLTLAMRRGDVNRIARTNGFTANDVSVLFAAVRHPAGCHLVWASRGADLNPDTLGMVLSTVRFTQ
jgi:hypothetical protein